MKLSDRGAMALICREGIAQGWYRDSKGILTIGIGHTAAAGEPSKPSPNFTVTVSGAFNLFRKDVGQYEDAVNMAIKVPMKQHQFDAFVSICYNIGPAAFANATFVKKFNAGDVAGCANAIMLWTKDKELIGRRTAERGQFLNDLPIFKNFKATLYAVGENYKLGKARSIDLVREMQGDFAQEPKQPDVPMGAKPELEAAPVIPAQKQEETIMSVTKRWWQSKSIWGAIRTIASFSGLFGISFDAETMTLSVQLDTLVSQVLAGGIPGGAVLSWVGRVAAKKAIV